MTLEHGVAAAGDDRVCGQRWALQWIEPREGSEYSKCTAVLTPAVCVTHTGPPSGAAGDCTIPGHYRFGELSVYEAPEGNLG